MRYLGRRAAELRQQNLDLDKKLTAAEDKRLELEKALAPRELYSEAFAEAPMIDGRGAITNVDILRPFRWMKVKLEFLPDVEVQRAAGSIRDALTDAGYKNIELIPRVDINTEYFDGVQIQTYQPPYSASTPETDANAWRMGGLVGDAFVRFFTDAGWKATPRSAERGELQKNELAIVVGFKPSPNPRFTNNMEDMKKNMQEEREKIEKEVHDFPAVKFPDLNPN